MTRLSQVVCAVLSICVFTVTGSSVAGEPQLDFYVGDEKVSSISLPELKDRIDVTPVKLLDPFHRKVKNYLGFPLHDVLKAGLHDVWESDLYTEFVFTALDGYKALSSRSTVMSEGGFIVFADEDNVTGWEPIGRKQADPGPFYLVWTGAEQTTQNEYPWPWQLASISILRFEQQYPKVVPQGVAEASGVYKGYVTFKGRCVRCHAMNQQGGKIGPDLNQPKSIVTYRSQDMIKEFIRNPSDYRYTHMPDHRDLSEQALDELIAYFNHMSLQVVE